MTERRAMINAIKQLEQEIIDCYAAADRWTISAHAKEDALKNLTQMCLITKRQAKKLNFDAEVVDAFVQRVVKENDSNVTIEAGDFVNRIRISDESTN